MPRKGKVYLVGAGPGNPGLLTIKGLDCLRSADLVLYDGLVNPLLLRFATGQVERTHRIVLSTVDCSQTFGRGCSFLSEWVAAQRHH